MSFHRRRVLAALGLAGLLSMGALPAAAQGFPSKPVRLIVPAGAGAAPDVVARLVADKLGSLWGQTLIVDNKPGAGGIPGMSALARSPNDGYTLGFVPAAMAIVTPLVYRNPQFSTDADLVPVATVATSPLLLVTASSTGIKSLADLSRHARAHPGQVNFAAPQPNSLPTLAGQMVSKLGQMDLFTVPYPAPPAAVTAALSGDAALTADGLPGLLPHIRSGKLRALAVTSSQRLPGFETIPTVAETYPGFEAIGWFSLFAPVGTPAAVIEQVNRDVAKVMQLPDLVARLADMGIYPRTGNVVAAREFYQGQRDTMKRFVTELGLQPQ
ncbi:tripartite-type tricarboxylate transporter receptor subunit TctC [Sphaerotilus hippei]|uniref:Tripartite-type tricarboxylate transporter receptor subunit TctC n=1 Tax=Sphaerotilus hippei TaxID=744406 RepID=A0A318HDT2_9BURK|nr:tripartite tricarboxylate transporter substrate binding protein [Sphaerotilus hippei]PXW97636.1 tripartite-type tricarboxylate transporter receptor subunit TctC [Sphaerotilus hippei]